MRYIYFLIFVVFFTACSVKTPPLEKYTLNPKLTIPKTKNNTCKDKSIKIIQPFSSNIYVINEIKYVVNNLEENSYNNSSWSISISDTFYFNILKALRKSEVFKNVENYATVSVSDYILEVEISDFKQYFSKDLKKSYIVADVTFNLVDKKSLKTISQKRFYKKIPSKTNDVKGGVEALNKALDDILKEMIVWIEGRC